MQNQLYNSISGSMRLVRRGNIQTRKPSSIYHISQLTINWAYTTKVVESKYIGGVVMSGHVCEIMISTGVKSVTCYYY